MHLATSLTLITLFKLGKNQLALVLSKIPEISAILSFSFSIFTFHFDAIITILSENCYDFRKWGMTS